MPSDLRLAEQALLLLIQRLDELLHFIEPSPVTLQAYSHKARELLILSCTEVENAWKSYLRIANVPPARSDFTTNDYVKLLVPLHLADYQISLPRYSDIQPIRPFLGWSAAQPTKSLPWYDAQFPQIWPCSVCDLAPSICSMEVAPWRHSSISSSRSS